jgi:hypothetical protein
MAMSIDELKRHIRNLVNYTWRYESEDFARNYPEGADHHIFRDIVALDNFLDGRDRTAEQAAEIKED